MTRTIELEVVPAAPATPASDGATERRSDEGGDHRPDASPAVASARFATRDFATPASECNFGHNNGNELTFAQPAFSYTEAAFVASAESGNTQENTDEIDGYNTGSQIANLAFPDSRPRDLATRDSLGDVLSEAVRQGSKVTFKVTETVPTGSSSYAEQGASLKAKSDQAAMDFATGLRGVDLPWGGAANDGAAGFSGKILGKSLNVLHVMGGLLLAAAVIPIVVKPRRMGLAAAIAGAGVTLIAAGTVAEKAPWVLVLAFVAFVAALGWLAFSAWKTGRLGMVLDRVQLGVEAAPSAAGELVKASIADAAGPEKHVVKREIAASKRRTGEPTAAPKTASSGTRQVSGKARLAEDGQGVAPSRTEAASGG